MRDRRVPLSGLMMVLFLTQLLLPVVSAFSANPPVEIETSNDLELLHRWGMEPSGELENGWYNPSQGAGTIDLLHRQATLTPTSNWLK